MEEKEEYPILEKEIDFVKKFVDRVIKGVEDKKILIEYTRNGFGLGVKTKFQEELKKEYKLDDESVVKLVSSIFRVYTSALRDDSLFKTLKEKHSDKIDQIIKSFQNTISDDIVLKAKSSGNFFENIRWNILNLEDSSEAEAKIEPIKYIELTIGYSNPHSHADHYENISLKLSKMGLADLLNSLNKVQRKLAENEKK